MRIEDSPFWVLHPYLCRDVVIRRVQIRAHGASRAAVHGAKAVLIRSVTANSLRTLHTGMLSYDSRGREELSFFGELSYAFTPRLTGTIEQFPPAFSAKKVAGDWSRAKYDGFVTNSVVVFAVRYFLSMRR